MTYDKFHGRNSLVAREALNGSHPELVRTDYYYYYYIWTNGKHIHTSSGVSPNEYADAAAKAGASMLTVDAGASGMECALASVRFTYVCVCVEYQCDMHILTCGRAFEPSTRRHVLHVTHVKYGMRAHTVHSRPRARASYTLHIVELN